MNFIISARTGGQIVRLQIKTTCVKLFMKILIIRGRSRSSKLEKFPEK